MDNSSGNPVEKLKQEIDSLQGQLDDTCRRIREFMLVFEATYAKQIETGDKWPSERTESRRKRLDGIIQTVSRVIRDAVLSHQPAIEKIEAAPPVGQRTTPVTDAFCRINDLCDRMDAIHPQ